ncbi:CHRD domain-containing protein [Massilia sp. YIM B02443]|uniref:CHRD domain-containing protein n=1 Tax=Massilia sp. YIM B02443 TaxID=3050127 RepID=UPI0025B6363B|nr:CHRD domain-containing protein [Massilia sp. YIM B02443]MDN4036316.1 CHRD domain-containing protein [Massilia sp. YIM B02443]
MKKAHTLPRLAALALAASTLFAATASQAVPVTYRAVASGPAEDIPNGSPGSSVSTFEIDDMILRAEVPFRDLSAPAISAHIHCCTTDAFRGVAPIAIPFVDFPLGGRAGDYSYSFDLGDAAIYDPAFLTANGGTPQLASGALIDAFNANQAYVNIHSERYPAGEIRGFAVAAPIPEPTTWGMLGLGLGMLALYGRRRVMPPV